jgi:hypothetical protein
MICLKRALAFGSLKKFACSWIGIRMKNADLNPSNHLNADPDPDHKTF